MLKIGDFAGITGLSVKALRHYDEKSVLTPEMVDSDSGYRLYAESQVRAGVIIRALRAAGMPLQDVRSVSDETSALDALETHREQVLADRAKEDRAYIAAVTELHSLAVPLDVALKSKPTQLFVGQLLSINVEEVEGLSDEDANNAFAEQYERLAHAGAWLSGNFWTTMRAGENGEVELVGCWEVRALPEPGTLRASDIVGTLPARAELTATWRSSGGEELPEGSTHPAVVALFDALDEHQIELDRKRVEIRQTVITHAESDYSVEVSISLPPSSVLPQG